ncbi:unnamed protein product, partial [Urochloa humidicola]
GQPHSLPSRSILAAAAAPRDGGAACSRWSEWQQPGNMASDPGRRRQSVVLGRPAADGLLPASLNAAARHLQHGSEVGCGSRSLACLPQEKLL